MSSLRTPTRGLCTVVVCGVTPVRHQCAIIVLVTALMVCVTPARAQFATSVAFPALTFNYPVDIQNAGDGSHRLFIVEQAGIIRVVAGDTAAAAAPIFLDIRNRVDHSGTEQGLLGLAFHPRYRENGLFYVNYTAANPSRTVIARFRRSSSDPNAADAASAAVLLEFSQPYANHNGGQLAFGADGFLYIATGDGGSAGDPQGNGQNRRTLLGKILRIDVDHTQAGLPYAIPRGNPYKDNEAGLREEIWAYGLRNPWRFSFDAVTGELWAGDVGQNRREEIDIIRPGGNYGWNVMEASLCYNPPNGCDTTGLILPLWEYGRDQGICVTGGGVYHGRRVPELEGEYVYADYGTGTIWGLRRTPSGVVNRVLVASGKNIPTFGVDEEGELYFSSFDGRINRFVATVTGMQDPSMASPVGIHISELWPNPLMAGDSEAVLGFTLDAAAQISITMTDMLGRIVLMRSVGTLPAGTHRVRIESGALPAGAYLCSVNAGRSKASITVMVTR